ncbi:MAG TPA: hypothetical protein VD738_09420 [Nitrospira sp.]|nr:hypothetical protein [Nitrospira sp.]
MATKKQQSKQPATTFRCGNIKATIWQNVSEKGPFFATTFSRPFKDQSGAWRNGTSFGLHDLEALVTVAHQAKDLPAPQAGGVDRCSCPKALSGFSGSLRPSGGFLHYNGNSTMTFLLSFEKAPLPWVYSFTQPQALLSWA